MTDARIIYVTGMKPKPVPDLHRPELLRVLAGSLGRVDPEAARWVVSRPENFVLVSWTHLLYQVPRDPYLDVAGVDRLLASPFPDNRDRSDADSLWLNMLRAWHLIGDSFPWLSAIVASPALKVTLADAYRYLEDQDGCGGEVRQLLIDQLTAAFDAGDRVLLIGHSLGSVIAYDCLWHLSRTQESQAPGLDHRVALLMTLGSPLATRFIRQRLKGADRRGADRYPDNVDRWVNVSARGELVALHRRIKPFFSEMERLGLIQSIEDVPGIYNHFRTDDGRLNPHKSYGYLNHSVVAERICRWLER